MNRSRLAALKAARTTARLAERSGAGQFVDHRRQAQIAARHALQTIGVGLRGHDISAAVRGQVLVAAIHAAELQLPEAWLPFVVSR